MDDPSDRICSRHPVLVQATLLSEVRRSVTPAWPVVFRPFKKELFSKASSFFCHEPNDLTTGTLRMDWLLLRNFCAFFLIASATIRGASDNSL